MNPVINNTQKKETDFSAYYIALYRKQYVPTSKEEMKELIYKAQNGDKESFDTVILRNLGLAISCANKYSFACEQDDLIQQGIFGLIKAIENFNITLDFAFSTYAWNWIKQSITRYINNCGSSIRYPVHVKEKISSYKLIMKQYHDDLDNGKYDFNKKYEYAKTHGAVKSQSEFIMLEDLLANETISSLDREIDLGDGAFNPLGGLIPDKTVNIEEDCINGVIFNEINDIMKEKLSKKELFIMNMRYGFNEYSEPMTLEEIGTTLGITRERVRQIQKRALEKIQRATKKYAKDFNY